MSRARSAIAVTVIAVFGLLATGVSAAGASRARAVDECTLLTDAQAEKIMGTEPFGGGAPDNDSCSWQTDPADRANGVAYVTLKVEPAAKLLKRYDGDLRTYLDESTNVGIDPLPKVGDEAFSTYSPLSGPGTADGISVLVGTRVLRVGFQPVESVKNPSPELDQVVRIVKKAVAKVRDS